MPWTCVADFQELLVTKGPYLPIYTFYTHTHTPTHTHTQNSFLSLSRCYSSAVIAQWRFSEELDNILPDLSHDCTTVLCSILHSAVNTTSFPGSSPTLRNERETLRRKSRIGPWKLGCSRLRRIANLTEIKDTNNCTTKKYVAKIFLRPRAQYR